MNKEELIKGYKRRTIEVPVNTTTVKHEKGPHQIPKPTTNEAPKPIPFYTVDRLCKQASEIRGLIRTAGYCKHNGADVELLSHESTNHRQIILDFRVAATNVELNSEFRAPVPVELAGSVCLDMDRIKIMVSFCKNLRDCQELTVVLNYYESVSKYA